MLDPERFRPLHALADQLVRDLEARFDVVVEEVAPLSTDVTGGGLSSRRLTPREGAALTITWTGFPGVSVAFGAEHVELFPRCGCDRCDEQLDDVAADLSAKVAAVTTGDFSEPVGGYDFRFPDGAASGRAAGLRGPLGRTRRYEPWPLRDDQARTGG